MRPLTPRERRTIRLAVALVGIYLAAFYGLKGWRYLEAKRARHAELSASIGALENRILLKKEEERTVERLRSSLRLDLENLREDTVVAESLEAIHKAAQTRSIVLGASKEVQGISSSTELARFQLQGKGSVLNATKFVHSVLELGYPLAIEHIDLKSAGMKPGNVELSLSVVVFNLKGWKTMGDETGV